MKKQRITILMAALFILIGLVPVHASAAGTSGASSLKTMQVESQPIRLVFDGKELSLPKGLYAFLYQDRTYIPIRYLSYALLKQVGWDGDKFEVTISEPNKAELAELKKQLLSASGGKTSTVKQKLTMIFREATLVFDGKTKALPKGQSLFIHEGSMYVPLRFLAESIGTKIEWDQDTRTVRGQSKAYQASQGGGKEEPEEEPDGDGGNGNVGGEAGGGGTGGGLPGKASYEQITSNAEAQLYALKSGCQSTLLDTAVKYVDADEADKPALYAKLQAELAACTADFEKVVSETSAALTAGGYSTDIIAEYRAEFEAELEAGRKLAESL